MPIKTMDDLFVDTLKDIYYAEKHIQKALPGMPGCALLERGRGPAICPTLPA
jgi:ferritin-like metal-binding protein YciE